MLGKRRTTVGDTSQGRDGSEKSAKLVRHPDHRPRKLFGFRTMHGLSGTNTKSPSKTVRRIRPNSIATEDFCQPSVVSKAKKREQVKTTTLLDTIRLPVVHS